MIQKMIFAPLFVIGVLTLTDWLIYAIKSAPKSATIQNFHWKIGFVCWIMLVYWFMNGYKFW